MTYEEMKELAEKSKQDLVDKLNQEYSENPDLILDQNIDIEQFDSICLECYGETSGISAGDEGWTVCSSCRQVEGRTSEASLIESLDIAYIWATKTWVVSNEQVGQVL